ncbi:NAD(P)H pyrophosphatase NUDT13, mitochondrial isoform X1 [Pelodiscus sinensis]|uniref:NAD(P)H pyrophosphatase NUDT13, mitochondrial isoform X1 n=1 Tax=Pelodiscus sinensis TaxID=13735 RepID=UPI00070420A0|nr:nucleoside diphosphate-linked moiety X motif 13 isoform X1 [Pelodiscus sinensis]|eukprot:XP_014433495.1 nucleoside diphosphate-linked moiety X motif 13 isoform X1 [Pelodiscus sinensis]
MIYPGVYRRTPSLWFRLHSTYVRKMRYLFDLKEDDDICRQAQNSGTFYLFHNLSPFLQKVGSKYLAPQISAVEMKSTLGKLKHNEQMIENSVLIGCSDACMAYFALDLGFLEKSVIESELKGSFTELRKALFQLDGKDRPLLSSAQALLRWHDTHQFCSKTGQPTQKNVAGSKRVCRTSGIIYYPQMSPVVITLVSNGSQCLLARQAAFPKGMYSALAGFCDVVFPGETLEETVRREVAEEVGLEVESLWYSASQHWPFPNSSLMIACHAIVQPQQTKISMNKLELEAARWFSLEEIEEALKRGPKPLKQENQSVSLCLPPKWAIAHQLIQEWVKQQASKPA